MKQAQLFAGFTTPTDATTDGVAILTAQRARLAVRTIKLSEQQVTRAIVEFLQTRGWTPHRKHVGKFLATQIALEVVDKLRLAHLAGGLNDFDFMTAYEHIDGAQFTLGKAGLPDWLFTHPHYPAFFVEMKATGEKPRDIQMAVLEQLAREGYPTTWADGFEKFERWYRATLVPLARP